ncbi:hypothetical protein JR316_0006737 [Psilocybe cubensis]|uniref:Uncharacterized protein n=2 Tax=Psilocybe cubensis TaxID=181762 RepID=A0ACB8GYV3_PSICU|nr:hypothetical protein JR316_0006737 [Psilocybe cubensis]KAH9480140.1 hypothetical protein JR316_0006737 [Psilocybe cubensis]
MVTVRVVKSTNGATRTTSSTSGSSAFPLRGAQETAPRLTRSRAKQITQAQPPSTQNQAISRLNSDAAVLTGSRPTHAQEAQGPIVHGGFRLPTVGNRLVPLTGDPYYPPSWPWTTPAQAGPRFTIHLKKGYIYPFAPLGRSLQPLKIFVDEDMKSRLPVADISFFSNRDGMAQTTVVDYNHKTYLIMGYWDNSCPVNANLIRICSIPWKGQLVVFGLGSRTRILQRPAGSVADVEQALRFFIRDCVVAMMQNRRWPRLISLRVDLKSIVM